MLLSVRFWFEGSSLTTEMIDSVFCGAEVVSVKYKKGQNIRKGLKRTYFKFCF